MNRIEIMKIIAVNIINIREFWLNATSEIEFCPISPPAKKEVTTTRIEEPIEPAISLDVLNTVDASSLLSETIDIAHVKIGMNNSPNPT